MLQGASWCLGSWAESQQLFTQVTGMVLGLPPALLLLVLDTCCHWNSPVFWAGVGGGNQ